MIYLVFSLKVNDDKKITKNPSSLFVEYLLENEKNLIITSIRLTEIVNLLQLFQQCKIVGILAKCFGILKNKFISNEIFAYFVSFIKYFQEITGGFTEFTIKLIEKQRIDFEDEIQINFITIEKILSRIQFYVKIY